MDIGPWRYSHLDLHGFAKGRRFEQLPHSCYFSDLNFVRISHFTRTLQLSSDGAGNCPGFAMPHPTSTKHQCIYIYTYVYIYIYCTCQRWTPKSCFSFWLRISANIRREPTRIPVQSPVFALLDSSQHTFLLTDGLLVEATELGWWPGSCRFCSTAKGSTF